MNKNIIGAGLVMLFISVILVSTSSLQTKNAGFSGVVENQNQWQIEQEFASEDKIGLELIPGAEWSSVFEGFGEKLPVNVTLVSPGGGETVFELLFEQSPWPPEKSDQPWEIYATKINILNLDEDALSVEEPVMRVGGIVKQNGTYTAKVALVWALAPPQLLRFVKELVEYKYQYTYLLPIGSVLSVAGIVISVWGARSRKGKAQRKRLPA